MRIRLARWWLLALIGTGSLPARAQSPETSAYKQTIQDALQEYEANRFVEARALFLRAHELQPSARTLRGLGLVEFQLRHYAEALHLLQSALDDPRYPLNPEQHTQTSELLRQASAFVGSYHLTLDPNASVLVDGEPVREDQENLVLDVGEHRLQVQYPGQPTQERRIDVKGGERKELRFRMEPSPTPVAAPANDPAPPPPAASDASSGPSARTVLGIVAASAAGLAGVTSIVTWRMSEYAADRWNDDKLCLQNNQTRERNCGKYQERANDARTWTTIGIIATAALSIGAVVLLWPTGEKAQAFNCGAGPGELGLACTARF